MEIFDKKFKEIFSSQIVSIVGGLIAGTILAMYTDKIFLIPGILILLPGFLEMRGNISGSLAARLASGMYLGIVNPEKNTSRIVKGNVFASIILAIVVSFVLGLVTFFFNYLVFGIITLKILFIPVIAGALANLIEIPLTLFFTFYFFRKGYDPDDIMGPFVTSTGDITSILSLLIVVLLI
ncbi:magnesium transporter [Candidatus Woesearchaeota archaeon]|nr:magnesium transporter [Candidatus Woesearchaeota archaeon]